MHRRTVRRTARLASHDRLKTSDATSERMAMADPQVAQAGERTGQGEQVPGMKSGFPCRFRGCRIHFAVADQSSMVALLAASEQRSEHEVAEHGYHHKRLAEWRSHGFGPFISRQSPPRSK
jgi:hypothetical protein